MPLLKSLNREAIDEDARARTKTYSSAVNKIRSRTEETLPETSKDVLTVENFEVSLQQLINSVSEFMTSLMNTKTRIEEGKIGAFSDTVFKDNVEKLMKLSTAYSQAGRILRKIYRAGEGTQSDINMLKDRLKESGINLNLDRISSDLDDLNTRTAQYSNMITAFDRIKNGITSGEFPDVAFDKSLTGLVRIGATEARDITRKKLEAREREGELIPDVLKIVGIKDDPLSLQQAVRSGELDATQVDDLIRFYETRKITPAEYGISSAERQREINVINRKYNRLNDALTRAARDAGLVVPVPRAALPPFYGMPAGRPGRPGVPPPRGRGKDEEDEEMEGEGLYGGSQTLTVPPDVETPRRFTPLRLYNHEGQDIYALRRYEV